MYRHKKLKQFTAMFLSIVILLGALPINIVYAQEAITIENPNNETTEETKELENSKEIDISDEAEKLDENKNSEDLEENNEIQETEESETMEDNKNPEIISEKEEGEILEDNLIGLKDINLFGDSEVTIPKNLNIRVEFPDSTYIYMEDIQISGYKSLNEYGVIGGEADQGYISPLHILAEAMVQKGDSPSTIDYSNNFLNDINGALANTSGTFFMYEVNGKAPVGENGWDSPLHEYKMVDNDYLVIYAMPYPGNMGMFDKEIYEASLNTIFPVTVLSKGYGVAPELAENVEILLSDINSINAINPTNVFTDKDGIAYISIDQVGEYTISTKSLNNDLSRGFAKVIVSKGDANQDKLDVEADIKALTIPEIVNTNEIRTDKITLANKGENLSTIRWTINSDIILEDGSVIRPNNDDKEVKLIAKIIKGEYSQEKEFNLIVKKISELENVLRLEAAKKALGDYYGANPVYGKDIYIEDVIKRDLAEKGFGDIEVELASSGNHNYIDSEGKVIYKRDTQSSTPINVKISLNLILNGATTLFTPSRNSVIPWDKDYVINMMNARDVSQTNWDLIKGENSSKYEVTKDLDLPRIVTTDNLATVEWKSSDEKVVKIENTGSGFKGVVYRPLGGDKKIILTAIFSFKNTGYNDESIITEKEIEITIKKDDSFGEDEIRENLKNQLDKVFTDFTYISSVNTEKINVDLEDVYWDIQLPRNFRVGINTPPEEIKASFSTTNENLLKINGFRGYIYRPLFEKTEEEVSLVISLSHFGISETKEIPLNLRPLTQEEIDEENKLMTAVKSDYFNGINRNANENKDLITENLSTFQEVRFNENNELEYSYSYQTNKDTGIKPRAIYLDKDPLDGDIYFESSRPGIIANSNLLVNRTAQDEAVTINSVLSSIVYERYAEIYPDNEDLKSLYRQPVKCDVIVKSTDYLIPSKDLYLEEIEIINRNQTSSYEVNLENDKYYYSILTGDQASRLEVKAKANIEDAIIKVNGKDLNANGIGIVTGLPWGFGSFDLSIESGKDKVVYTFYMANKEKLIEEFNKLPDPETATTEEIVGSKEGINKVYKWYGPLTDNDKIKIDPENKIQKLYDRLLVDQFTLLFNTEFTDEKAIVGYDTDEAVDFNNIVELKLKLKTNTDYNTIWASSNEDIISITNGSYSSSALVNRQNEDKEVKLVIKLMDKEDNSIYGEKEFTLIVKAVDQEIIDEANGKIDEAISKLSIIPAQGETLGTIKTLFTIEEEKVEGVSRDYWSSSNTSVIDYSRWTNKFTIKRPTVFAKNEEVILKTTMTHEQTGITRVVEYKLTVLAYTEEEVGTIYEEMKLLELPLISEFLGENKSLLDIRNEVKSIRSINYNDGDIEWLTTVDNKADYSVKWISSSNTSYIDTDYSGNINLSKRPDSGEGDKLADIIVKIDSNKLPDVVPSLIFTIPITIKEYSPYLESVEFKDGLSVNLKDGVFDYTLLSDTNLDNITVIPKAINDTLELKINNSPHISSENFTIQLQEGNGEIKISVIDKLNWTKRENTYNFIIDSREYFNNEINNLPVMDSEILEKKDSLIRLSTRFNKLSPEVQKEIDSQDKINKTIEKLNTLIINEELQNKIDSEYTPEKAFTLTSGDTLNSITGNIKLKTEGWSSNYESIWESDSDLAVISGSNINIIRPSANDGNKTANIKLSIYNKNNKDNKISKSFNITILALEESESNQNQIDVEEHIKGFDLDYTNSGVDKDNITDNILITGDTNTSLYEYEWLSSNEEIATYGYVNYSKKAYKISKPFYEEGKVDITATLLITKKGTTAKAIKEFNFTVLPFNEEESKDIGNKINTELDKFSIKDRDGNNLDLNNIRAGQIYLHKSSNTSGFEIDFIKTEDTDNILGTIQGGNPASAWVNRPKGNGESTVKLLATVRDKTTNKLMTKEFVLIFPHKNDSELLEVKENLKLIEEKVKEEILFNNIDLNSISSDLNKFNSASIDGSGNIVLSENASGNLSYLLEWELDSAYDTSKWISSLNFKLIKRPNYGIADKKVGLKLKIVPNLFKDEIEPLSTYIPMYIKAETDKLNNILIDGEPLEGFNEDTNEYIIKVSDNASYIDIKAVPYVKEAIVSINNIISKEESIELNEIGNTIVSVESYVYGTGVKVKYTLVFAKDNGSIEDKLRLSASNIVPKLLKTKAIDDFFVISLANMKDYKDSIPANYPDIHLDKLVSITNKQAAGERISITDIEKAVIGIVASGNNPRYFVEDVDLIERIYNPGKMTNGTDHIKSQGINAMVFGLIALDTLNYEIPEDAQWNRNLFIEEILKLQKKGIWDSPDMTGMTIISLAPYYETDLRVNKGVNEGLNYLSNLQNNDGSFESCETTAQVILALYALGINPLTDSRFIKDKNILEGLLSFELADGFSHKHGGTANDFSSEQALRAIAQALYFIEGNEGSMYQFGTETNETIDTLKIALLEKINQAKAVDKNKYTKESYRLVLSSIENGENIYNDDYATKDNIISGINQLVKAISLLKEVEKEKPEEPNPSNKEISFTLYGGKIDEKNNKFTKETWITNTRYRLNSGDTVYEVFKTVLSANGYTYTGDNGYIRSITRDNGYKLEELDAGKNSGWMFKVNGKFPEVGASSYILENGDQVEWIYTTDYTVEDSNWSGGSPSGSNKNKENTIELEDKEIVNGKAEIKLSNEEIEKLTDMAKNLKDEIGENLIIQINTNKEFEELEINLDTNFIKELAKKDHVSLDLESKIASLNLDNNLIKEIKEKDGKSLNIQIKSISNESEIKGIESIKGNKKIYDISLYLDGEKISDLGKGSIMINIFYELKEDEDIENINIYHILEDNSIEEIIEFKYDSKNYRIKFSTTSLSYFVINYNKKEIETKEDTDVKRFVDVLESHFAYRHIYSLVEKGIITGVSDNRFEPDRSITRAEFITILAKLSGDTLTNNKTPFIDVNYMDWYGDAIFWAYTDEIIFGKFDTLFAPDDYITREEMAVILNRFMNIKEMNIQNEDSNTQITDTQEISEYALSSVDYMFKKSIIVGKDNNRFAPKDNATRGEAVTMINRLLEELE